MYEVEWKMYMDGEWNCHDFMAELMEQGLSQNAAEQQFALRYGELIRFKPWYHPNERPKIVRH